MLGKFDISDVVGLHAKLATERSPQLGNMHFGVMSSIMFMCRE